MFVCVREGKRHSDRNMEEERQTDSESVCEREGKGKTERGIEMGDR